MIYGWLNPELQNWGTQPHVGRVNYKLKMDFSTAWKIMEDYGFL